MQGHFTNLFCPVLLVVQRGWFSKTRSKLLIVVHLDFYCKCKWGVWIEFQDIQMWRRNETEARNPAVRMTGRDFSFWGSDAMHGEIWRWRFWSFEAILRRSGVTVIASLFPGIHLLRRQHWMGLLEFLSFFRVSQGAWFRGFPFKQQQFHLSRRRLVAQWLGLLLRGRIFSRQC